MITSVDPDLTTPIRARKGSLSGHFLKPRGLAAQPNAMIGSMGLRRFASAFAGGALATGMRRLNARHPWSHNDYFHSWILANLPERCRTALDVGCGQGELLAALAPHVDRVIGNDIDPEMRGEAARRCAGLPNVSVTGGPWAEADGPFDVVTMIAVLHHLEVEAALGAVKRLLAPGGRLLAVGLAQPHSFPDHLWDVASMITNPVIGYITHPWPTKHQPRHPPFPVRDPTMSFDELREILDIVMPGATARHQLGFRHTIAWTKP